MPLQKPMALDVPVLLAYAWYSSDRRLFVGAPYCCKSSGWRSFGSLQGALHFLVLLVRGLNRLVEARGIGGPGLAMRSAGSQGLVSSR